jgi:predicted DNA-binding transcriptional regulator YafY
MASNWHLTRFDKERSVVIDYTDHRGKRATRRILPLERLTFGAIVDKSSCWMITAIDLDDEQIRTFAVKNIHSWVERR